MTIADKIYEEVQALPNELAREVLDFIGFIESKHDVKSAQDRDIQKAQGPAMNRISGLRASITICLNCSSNQRFRR